MWYIYLFEDALEHVILTVTVGNKKKKKTQTTPPKQTIDPPQIKIPPAP